jgi:hypothetical protein
MVGLYGLLYSFGKVNHNLLFIITPLVMTFSGWGTALSADATAERRRFGSDTGRATAAWPLILLALLVGFAWFTAGFSKLIGGWLDPSSRAVQGHIIKQIVLRERTDLLASSVAVLPGSVLWEVADWTTVCFEIGMLAAVLHVRMARFVTALAVLFHTGTALVMNIGFFVILLPVYLAFADWDAMSARLRGTSWAPRFPRSIWLAAGAVTSVGLYLWGSPLLLLEQFSPFSSDLMLTEALLLAAASCFAVLYLAFQLAGSRRKADFAPEKMPRR